ncbi:MAG: ATP-grasp domain-containing protein [bacterium]
MFLSDYFPTGTCYFYGYPAGEDESFFNKVPVEIEELVAARANCCAGSGLDVINFAATNSPIVDQDLLDILSIPGTYNNSIKLLPQEIGLDVHGKSRNEAIMKVLANNLAPGSLVMAQPFIDDNIKNLYQIPAELISWLNDKDSMTQFLNHKFMPKRYAKFQSGEEFINESSDIKLPYVVKISSSSSGDGVYICHKIGQLESTRNKLKDFVGTIIVEQYIPIIKNYALHFGISWDESRDIDFIGINEQLTTDQGDFLGGIINSTNLPDNLLEIKDYIFKDLLVKIRKMGWYGVGGLDVILDEHNNAYIIDCNFRMTGMTAYHFLISQNKIEAPIVSFMAELKGSKEVFKEKILPYFSKYTDNKIGQIIALSHHEDSWYFNGSLSYKNREVLKMNSKILLDLGVESGTLLKLV